MSADLLVQLFARYPRPGQVKSRLIPTLGERVACELQLAMLHDLLARLAPAARIELWGTEPRSLPHYRRMLETSGAGFQRQRGEDLGLRMEGAVDNALGAGDTPVLIGADCPQIDAALIAEMQARLQRGAQAVMVPANDGGYVALALSRSDPALFRDIAWGGDEVADKTLQAMRRCGIDCAVLAECFDVDTAADLPLLDTLSARDNPALQRWLAEYRTLY